MKPQVEISQEAAMGLLAACEAQKKIIKAQSDLLVAYRFGGRPSEKTLIVLSRQEGVEKLADDAIAMARQPERRAT